MNTLICNGKLYESIIDYTDHISHLARELNA